MIMDNVDEVVLATELLPMLEMEANSKHLNVYVFSAEEVKKYHNLKSEKLGVALLAKDEDNATINLRNLRRCYLIRFE